MGLAPTASAEPVRRLPDADLVCGSVTLESTQWVAVPQSDTLWILEGDLAGHYVILGDTHYRVPGYQEEPPPSYEGLTPVGTRTRGVKAGLDTMTCEFVSRWEIPDVPVFSVVGPITIAKVPGATG